MLGMLKKYTVELCPEVNGKISNNGTPIENLLIERSLTYADEEYLDNCITNANGEFSFEAKSIKSRLPGNILHEPVVRQAIYLDVESNNYLLWYAYQDGISTIEAFKPKLNNLIAEITNPEKDYRIETNIEGEKSYKVFSICNLK
ncbi:DUF6795 domain-containing protein [Shewanella sp. ENK2]|uniref:DUF6795 domain-containing protein n=1 Tax=Shewanella sp. ENK2 TaxID=2775245 RepID=UPI0037497875